MVVTCALDEADLSESRQTLAEVRSRRVVARVLTRDVRLTFVDVNTSQVIVVDLEPLRTDALK